MSVYIAEFTYKEWGGREYKSHKTTRLVKADNKKQAEIKAHTYWVNREKQRFNTDADEKIVVQPNPIQMIEVFDMIE